MDKLLGTIVVLALASSALSLNLNGILGMQEAPLRNLGEPEVVEVVRWRQPVCLTPAKGVQPCLLGLKRAQSNYEKTSKSDEKSLNDAKDRSIENSDDEKSAGSIDTKLLSPEVTDSVSIDELEPSSLDNSNEESQDRILKLKSSIPEEKNVGSEDSRQGKYLVLSGRGRNVASKPPPIYVTKIRDSPVVATLVAYNCLPDIGIPLCDDVVIDSKPFQYSLNLQFPTKPSYVSNESVNNPDDSSSYSLLSDNESEESANFWEDPNSPHYDDGKPNQSSSKPPAIQAIHDYIHKPDVVSANEKPEVKPVLVVEPTPKPGLFGGLWRPGFWDKPTTTAKPNVVVIQHQNPPVYIVEDKPSKPAFVEVAEKPNLHEIIYKPENDISNRPGLLDLFSKPTNEKPATIARPTEKPGIFGGLWSNPIKPEDPDKPLTSGPSIFDGFPNIFAKPTSKPLIIDRPDDKPLLVEKPVYVVEKPVIPTLTDIFRPEGTTALDNQDHEVIKDPVYVYQKPAQHPGIFGGVFGSSYSTTPTTAKPGIFDGWNIFHNKPNNNKPIIVIDEQPSPVIIQRPQKPVVVIEKPEKPIIVEEKPHKPAIVVQKPLLPTKPILVEDVPAKPVAVETKPIALYVPEKPKPVVIVEHPAKPIVLVQKPSKPQVGVIIENAPEHHPIGESTSSAFATAVSGTTGTASASNLSVGSTGSTVIASGSSGAIAVAGADSGSSVAIATAGASSGSSASHGGYPAGSYTGTETGSHADAGAHASAGSSTTNIGSHIGTSSEAYAGAESSAINTGSNIETESESHAGAGSSATNTASHAGTGSYTGAGTGSYVKSASDSHAVAAAASTDDGVYAAAETSANDSTTAIGASTGRITDTIIYTNDEAVLLTLKNDFNGQAEDTKDQTTFKTEAEDIENE